MAESAGTSLKSESNITCIIISGRTEFIYYIMFWGGDVNVKETTSKEHKILHHIPNRFKGHTFIL